jgi:Fe2+ transport system protein FeoA
MKLSELRIGEKGEILEIETSELEMALMRLGLVQGDRFTVSDAAPMGGPIALRIPGGKLALRKADAGNITVRKIK